MTKNYESGRSMVEMLGTLAIIGVLSVGGIAGYSYGMDKYKANQTINDVMLMGVDMITQLSQNREKPTLSEWGTKTSAGYDFTVVQNPEDDTQYGIQITGIPSSICKQVGDGLKQTVAVYVGSDDYNTDTETDPCDESDSNTMEFYFEKSAIEPECTTDTDCGEGNYCDINIGWCFNGNKPIASYGGNICSSDTDCGDNGCASCNNGKCNVWDFNTKACSVDTQTSGMCQWGKCIKNGCNELNPCTEDKEYCASPNISNSNCEAFPDNSTGACVKADFKTITIGTEKYYISSTLISWWDADALCKTLSKKIGKEINMPTISDLVIGWDGYHNCYTNTELANSLFSEAWGDTTLEMMAYVWTRDKAHSCNMYMADISRACIGSNSINSPNTAFALCK